LAIADGGTGASTAANARTNLGVTATGQDTTYAFRSNNLSDLASASSARTNLGLGTIATQNANAVSITGGSISGITDLAVADGGTGASDAATARSNLGVPSATGSGASGTWNINVTGNAATATNATNATNSTNATNATNSTNAANLITANFTVQQSGSDLVFLYNGTRIAKLTSAGVLSAIQVAGNDTI
jgi:hypothetical protein